MTRGYGRHSALWTGAQVCPVQTSLPGGMQVQVAQSLSVWLNWLQASYIVY